MVLLAEAEEIIRSPSGERRAEMVRAFAAKLAMAESSSSSSKKIAPAHSVAQA